MFNRLQVTDFRDQGGLLVLLSGLSPGCLRGKNIGIVGALRYGGKSAVSNRADEG